MQLPKGNGIGFALDGKRGGSASI